ncbi:MAG: TIGR03986 family CRISPR-associated RAMP protein [Aphanizomenon gracile PMC627.10]|nr:TIGR03986 family CRISPR-associated RAMP protein [Aphanizomenon gracile PMC627.10]
MNPRHNDNIPIEVQEKGKTRQIKRRAIAPYNFVELPESVVEVSQDSLISKNVYCNNRYTGRIECTLTTESPLYIRCGFTKEEFECGAESKDLPNFFYTNPSGESTKPVIPGSSLRGMLRNLVEIITFSKIDKVTTDNLVYRAVGDTSSLGHKYRDYFLKNEGNKTFSFLMNAGYMTQKGSDWYIRPASEIIDGVSFARIEKIDIPNNLPSWNNLCNAFEVTVQVEAIRPHSHNKGRIKLNYAKARLANNGISGVVVKTGHAPSKHMEFVFGLPHENSTNDIFISSEIVQEYKDQITDGQKQLIGESCIFQEMQPVFYILEKKKLLFFGHTMMFRLPYEKSVEKFVPEQLRDLKKIDLADAIFGWVDKQELSENMRQRASRVFITDAQYQSDERGIWYKGNFNDTITPQVLLEPKPTCFQHYLVQRKEDNPEADKAKLKHYASQPESETVIRGHKLYWHKGKNHNFEHPEGNSATGDHITKIKPINSGVKFKFDIHFENLTNIELGALLWVIDIAQREDKQYRLKLGMGKPLGMGSIKIEPHLYLSDRNQRYISLFDNNDWDKGEPNQPDNKSKYKDDFEKELLGKLHESGIYQDLKKFHEIPRVKMLMSMLIWEENPSQQYINNRRYMEIQREKHPRINDANEYKERPVLPNPLQVIKDENPSNTPKPKPKTKPQESHAQSSNVEKPIKKDQQPQKKPKENSEGGNFGVLARPPKPPKQ